MTVQFSGNPRRYQRIAIWLTVGLNAWLYGAFASIQYFAYGETWPLGWKPVAITLVFTAWLARFYYRSMMRLDAQYGTGGSWRLVQRSVKLPELRTASKQPRR
jgi:hypothetical protein